MIKTVTWEKYKDLELVSGNTYIVADRGLTVELDKSGNIIEKTVAIYFINNEDKVRNGINFIKPSDTGKIKKIIYYNEKDKAKYELGTLSGEEITTTLYSSLGNATDGALTQKRATEAVEFSYVDLYQGEDKLDTGPKNENGKHKIVFAEGSFDSETRQMSQAATRSSQITPLFMTEESPNSDAVMPLSLQTETSAVSTIPAVSKTNSVIIPLFPQTEETNTVSAVSETNECIIPTLSKTNDTIVPLFTPSKTGNTNYIIPTLSKTNDTITPLSPLSKTGDAYYIIPVLSKTNNTIVPLFPKIEEEKSIIPIIKSGTEQKETIIPIILK